MSLRTDLGSAAVEYVKASPSGYSIDEICEHLMGVYQAELEAEGVRTMRDYVRAAAKQGLSERPHSDKQSILPGFTVPSTITVPVDEGRTIYVATESATREQARAHFLPLDANIAHAIEERRKYGEFLELLETIWEAAPGLTVGQCIERLSST